MVQFQKIGEFRASRVQSFHFQRITKSTLKINFFENLQKLSLNIKEQSPKRKFEIQLLNFFSSPNSFVEFLTIFSFLYITPFLRLQKRFTFLLLLLFLGYITVKIFGGPATS